MTEPDQPPDQPPTPLLGADVARVDGLQSDGRQWAALRRPATLRLFAEHVYGVTPRHYARATGAVIDRVPDALDGTATRLEIACHLRPGLPVASMLVYVPNAAPGPAPAFLGLNFRGNHTVDPDPAIPIADRLPRRTDGSHAPGADAASWPLAEIIGRGYAVATCCADDIEPDVVDGPRRLIGIVGAVDDNEPVVDGPRRLIGDDREPSGWGALGAWAWGLSRLLDVLQHEPRIDAGRVAVIGHSRMGKAALWAGAQDERFALVVANESGCGGAALSRRRVGETVEAITRRFPHWFCPRFTTYAANESSLPVDQHELVAAVAPRPVYVASAADDRWSDPLGEYLGALGAAPVYRLLTGDGLSDPRQPPVGVPVIRGRMGYHVRAGGHAITVEDWRAYLDFADRQLGSGA